MSLEGIGSAATRATLTPERDQALRRAAQQLEGVFIEQLFKAMRETVPEGGLIDGGSGEEIFTGMLDRDLADQVALGWDRGLGAAIYRQLRLAISHDAPPADTPSQVLTGDLDR